MSRIAPSCRAPVGLPSRSRSIRPSAGSGVSLVTSAIASAALFTQAVWWSRLGRNAGRPPVTWSRSAAGDPRHRPAAAEHPGAAGEVPAVDGDRGQVLLPGLVVDQVAAQRFEPAL